ncbi:MAG: energy-coupling factor ABC transporter permease [Brevinematia bacterium]
MHIPEYLLNGAICPVTAGISIAGVGMATYFSIKAKEKPDALEFGIVTALIFVLQMLNFPISGGTSGHFLGISFAIFTLGIPSGIISMALVLTLQALVFADGGLNVLGANILNMALVGGLPAIFVYKIANSENRLKRGFLIVSSSWLSVVLASISCSFLLSVVYPASAAGIFRLMVITHSLIGIGEAIITLLATSIFRIVYEKGSNKFPKALPLSGIFIALLLLTPFTSKLPDGLEWVLEKYRLLKESEPLFVAPLPDYTLPVVQNEYLSTIISGLIGILMIILIALGVSLISRFIESRKMKKI